ncbi:MAG TPA: class A beta-lactamase-related serine hydrolase [Saprospiraceae bacterium]|nr:class A beta-lactamase-related serine hydrolase [Saprospiraceae bacterium]
MRFPYLLVILLAIQYPFGKKLYAQPNPKLEKKIIRSIKKYSGIDDQKVPNLLVIYAYDGAQGLINLDFNKDDTITLDPDKYVALGDASQFITAQLICHLAQDKNFSLQEDINQFLPQGYRNSTPISIEDLLTHRSGLPKLPSNFGQFEKDQSAPFRYYSDTTLWQFFHDFRFGERIGTYRYSLVGYALLQSVSDKYSLEILNPREMAVNQGHKEGKAIMRVLNYNRFKYAKGLWLSPNKLFQLIQETKPITKAYPIYPTKLQKGTYSSYGFHVIKDRRHQISLLKGATAGFTVMAAFDRERDRTLLVVADSQDYTGQLFYALSWFF